VARKDDPPLESEKTVRLSLMKLLLAESIDALNRIKKTAATICVEGRRARNDMAGARAAPSTAVLRGQRGACGSVSRACGGAERQRPEAGRDHLTTQREGARRTTMNIQRRIDEMKRWLDELAAAYEIPDPDEATKAILTAIVKIQLRLAQHAAGAVEAGREDPPEEPNEGESDD
jgi:hypothetical protein